MGLEGKVYPGVLSCNMALSAGGFAGLLVGLLVSWWVCVSAVGLCLSAGGFAGQLVGLPVSW